ncbi:GNAT family N-acetyltransferase [Solwaraspora sp. WMMD791]|uniref:GNAT family N-acetyltransferase n=1 Tax=Solwaraspora sp. WMMD791 TaxID=3016086 RepID=UPI00249C94C9|nr:GNAT family N-acetyltransferase [Solwaraspora sp. WMMD791]WFE25490.1 GNAT family N-acetyltransferase [Solwaraspora sp. WMMD791]
MLLRIERADFADPGLSVFLQAHLDDIAPTAPAESRHALDLTGLRKPGVRLWVALDGRALDGPAIVGTGALATVEPGHEEIKSMRTDPRHRGRGIATVMLDHLLADARARGVRRVSLETGSMEFFAAARALYAKAGFVGCAPFGNYRDDPNSTFMTKVL